MTTPLYRAPEKAAQMASQLMSAEAIEQAVAASNESMRDDVGRLLRAQDLARRLMLGDGDYAGDWRTEPGANDGMPIDVMADTIAARCAWVGVMNAFPDAPVHQYVMRIAEIDIEHPFVVHSAVLQAACQALGQPLPDWSDVDGFVASRRVLEAGPKVGQACLFVAADTSVFDGVVSHVWGPEMVSLTFAENGGTSEASSVPVVRQAESGARYVCVLR